MRRPDPGHPSRPFHAPQLHGGSPCPRQQMSRFPIHDDLTAPEASLPDPQGRLVGRGQLPNFLGVLAGSPAALRGYVRFRAELRHGTLPLATLERIALAVAEHYGSKPGIALHSRTAAPAGLGLDEVARARDWDSGDPRRPRCCATCAPLARRPRRRARSTCTRRRARPAGATSSCSRRSRSLALEIFTAMVNVAGEVPVDGSVEETRRAPRRMSRRCASGAEHSRPRAVTADRPARAGLLPALPRGGRAGRQALDRRDPRRPAARRRVRFTEIAQAVPDLSDRLLSERMKELEARGIVDRHVDAGRRSRVEYELTDEGPRARARLAELKAWARPLVGLTRTAAVQRARPRASTSLRSAMADRPQTPDDVKAIVAGAGHPLHPALVHRHPRPAEVLLDQRRASSTTPSRAGWASTAPRSPASTRSRSRT